MMSFLYVFLGAGLGGVLRYSLISMISLENISVILLCNIIGCFIAGYLAHYFLLRPQASFLPLFFITGMAGGFTTFSAFGLEMVKYYQKYGFYGFGLYVSLSVLGGLMACLLGAYLAKVIYSVN